MTGTLPAALPRAVIFDWDNTLVSNWGCVVASINAALTAFGMAPWTMEEGYKRIRHSLRDSFPVIFGDDWHRARDIFYAHFAENHIAYLETLDGAEALLRDLSDRGIYLAVVSNKKGQYLRAEAAYLGWDRYFGRLVGATDAPVDKPAVQPVDMALSPSGIMPGGDVWFVGDADVDMECAHRAGCLPILVGTTPAEGGSLDRFPPAFRLDGCGAISDLVQRIDDTISMTVAARP